MNFSSLVLVGLLLALGSCGNLLMFGSMAKNLIMHNRKDAIVLFYRETEDREIRRTFSNFGVDHESQILFSPCGSKSSDYESFAEEIGLKLDDRLPVMVMFKLGFQKFLSSTSDITSDGIQKWIDRVERGEVPRMMKSQPIPSEDGRALKTLVCDNYEEVVREDN